MTNNIDRTPTEDIFGSIGSWFEDNIIDPIDEAIVDPLTDWGEEAFNDVTNWVNGAITDSSAFLQTFSSFTVDTFSQAVSLATELGLDFAEYGYSNLRDLYNDFSDGVIDLTQWTGDQLEDLLSVFMPGALPGYDPAGGVPARLYAIEQAILGLDFDSLTPEDLEAIIAEFTGELVNAINDLAEGAEDNADAIVSAIENQTFSNYLDTLLLVNTINTAAGNIEGSLDGGFAALVTAVTNLPDYTGGLDDLNVTLEDIRDVLETGLGLTAEQIEDVVEAITDLPDYSVKLNQIKLAIEGVAGEIDSLTGDFTALGIAVGTALANLGVLLGDESDQTQALISALGSSMADSLANLVLATEEGFGAQAEAIADLQTSMEAAIGGVESAIGDLGDSLVTALATAFDELIAELDSSLSSINSSIGSVGSSVSTAINDQGDTLLGGFEALVNQLAENQLELNQQLESLAEAVIQDDTVVIDATGDTFYLDFVDGRKDKVTGFNPLPRRGEGGDELTAFADGYLRDGGLTVKNVQDRKGLKKMMGKDVDLIYRRDKDLLYWNANGDERGLREITDDGLKLGGRMARIEFEDGVKDKLRAGDFNIVRNPLDATPGDII